MAATVLLIIPACKPRQPAWATATSVPVRLQTKTGRQSAVNTTQTSSSTNKQFRENDIARKSKLEQLLDSIEPDSLTPREARDLVYRLKADQTDE